MIVTLKIVSVIVLTAICMSIYSFYCKVRESKKSRIIKYIVFLLILLALILIKLIVPEYKIFLIMFIYIAEVLLIEIADGIERTKLEGEVHNLVKTFAKIILTLTIVVMTAILFGTIMFNT